MNISFSAPVRLMMVGIVSGILMLNAAAQNAAPTTVTPTTPAPAKGIGPAPANSKQGRILHGALSPETRQTLAEAMNSYDSTAPVHPAPATK